MTFFDDLRYGVRSLLKAPGLKLVATLALGVGIGLNWVCLEGIVRDLVRVELASAARPGDVGARGIDLPGARMRELHLIRHLVLAEFRAG